TALVREVNHWKRVYELFFFLVSAVGSCIRLFLKSAFVRIIKHILSLIKINRHFNFYLTIDTKLDNFTTFS
ncbi:MAG: hypothetical protein PSN04_03510, partial [Methyloprofundus sp.]|nr:hypothetical protein [Methyloprofundus sp.]